MGVLEALPVSQVRVVVSPRSPVYRGNFLPDFAENSGSSRRLPCFPTPLRPVPPLA